MEQIDFNSLEAEFTDRNLPELPPDNLEEYIGDAIDPILCAKALQKYVEGKSPEAQNSFIRRGIDYISLRFTHEYIDRLVKLTIEDYFDITGRYEAADMRGILNILKTGNSVRAGGRMAFFEKHYYNLPIGKKSPVASLRLHSPGYLDHTINTDEGGQIISMPNFLTVPVTAINDYEILERGV